MKTKQYYALISLLLVSLIASGCGPGQVFGPTITPTATLTPVPTSTSTPTPTFTPNPTVTFTQTPVTKTFTTIVPANELWFNTGVNIIKGQEVTIRATGIVNTWGGRDISNSDANGQTTADWICDNTGCPIPGGYYGELIGKLGVGTPFRVGSSLDFTAPESGTLILTINDWTFEDNSGEFNVIVTVK